MIDLVFPDGSARQYPDGSTGRDVAAAISKSLEKKALLIKLDGQVLDLDRPLTPDLLTGERRFEILTREAPEAPIRGEASLWHGRMLIERGSRTTGCPVLRDGRRRVRDAQVELVNQYDYLLQGCPPEVASAAPAAPAPSTPTPSATPSAPPSAPTAWAIQLAAYQTRGEAEAMVRRLRARGYPDLRIDGDSAPYRVRLGRYATRDEAQRALAAYRRKEKKDGFITPVPAR